MIHSIADRAPTTTLDREWDGLAAHRDYPMVNLDNNARNAPCAAPW
jgi:transposase